MQLDATKPFLFIGQLGRNHLIVQAVRRVYPFCADYYDGNWIESKIEITAGAFRGTFVASLRADEFSSFRDEFIALNSSHLTCARFSALEEWLAINIERQDERNYIARCEAIDAAESAGNRLRFTVSFNQTDVPAILRNLNHIVEAFPIVGERRASERRVIAS